MSHESFALVHKIVYSVLKYEINPALIVGAASITYDGGKEEGFLARQQGIKSMDLTSLDNFHPMFKGVTEEDVVVHRLEGFFVLEVYTIHIKKVFVLIEEQDKVTQCLLESEGQVCVGATYADDWGMTVKEGGLFFVKVKECCNCGEFRFPLDLKSCEECKQPWFSYCDKDCMRQDWGLHCQICGAAKKWKNAN